MIKAIIFDCFGVAAEDGWGPFKRAHIGDNEQLSQELADLGKQNEYGMIDNDNYVIKVAELMQVELQDLQQAMNTRVPNLPLFAYITKELKPKYKIGMMSNANYDVMHKLFTPEQADVFDASVMSYECRLIKPDERMYALMAERLGVAMDECVYIDDQERYCVAAEEYGMCAVYFHNAKQGIAELQTVLGR